jgi:metal-responsive CopG/Arc/MetJ family transcriptional regulator
MGKLRDSDEIVVPEGEGPLSEAITIRMPKKMLERIEKAAKETENNRSDTILHLLRWAMAQYEKKGK